MTLLLLLLKSVEFDDDVALQSSWYSQEDRHACKQWTGYPNCSGGLQQSEQNGSDICILKFIDPVI